MDRTEKPPAEMSIEEWWEITPQKKTWADRLLGPLEQLIKQPIFGCRMCGQCILHETGLTCPMRCPKNLRNGPCGGVGMDGSCEVDRSRACIWYKIVDRSARLPLWRDDIHRRHPAVDWTLQGMSSWVSLFSRRDHRDRISPTWQEMEVPDKGDKPLRSGSRLERLLRQGQFVVVGDFFSAGYLTADPTVITEDARSLAGVVDAALVMDNGMGTPFTCALAMAALAEQNGLETVLHMTCRDRNRIGLQSDVLGAHAFGIRNILCISGDHPALGDHKEAKPVYDLDSVTWIALLRRMRDEGCFDSGRLLATALKIFIGGVISPITPPLEYRPHRLAKKIAAGVDFVISNPVFDVEVLGRYMERIRDLGLDRKVYILINVGALCDPGLARWLNKVQPVYAIPEALIYRLEGVPKAKRRQEGLQICVEQIQQVREMPGVSGIQIGLVQPDVYSVSDIVEAAGLSKRPVLVDEREAGSQRLQGVHLRGTPSPGALE